MDIYLKNLARIHDKIFTFHFTYSFDISKPSNTSKNHKRTTYNNSQLIQSFKYYENVITKYSSLSEINTLSKSNMISSVDNMDDAANDSTNNYDFFNSDFLEWYKIVNIKMKDQDPTIKFSFKRGSNDDKSYIDRLLTRENILSMPLDRIFDCIAFIFLQNTRAKIRYIRQLRILREC